MSHYKSFNFAIATILSSAIALLTSNNSAIAQSRNRTLAETNYQIPPHLLRSPTNNYQIPPRLLRSPYKRSNSNQSRPQTSPTTETQRKLDQSVDNTRRANEAILEQHTIEPVYNPTFDVPSY